MKIKVKEISRNEIQLNIIQKRVHANQTPTKKDTEQKAWNKHKGSRFSAD